MSNRLGGEESCPAGRGARDFGVLSQGARAYWIVAAATTSIRGTVLAMLSRAGRRRAPLARRG